jgi:uncharacterized membrane protein YvbJ
MLTVLTWFTTSIGKTVAKWASIVAVAVAVYWKIYADGQAAARAAQLAKDAVAAKDREKIDDHVRKMDDTAVRDELARWVRHD